MVYFNPTSSIRKRVSFSLLIVAVFIAGLFWYFSYRYVFNGMRYSIASYSYILKYRIDQMANVSEALHVTNTNVSNKDYAESVPVLLYHGLLGGSIISDGEGTNIEVEKFWEQMKTLKENGWNTITVQDFYDFKKGIKTLPPKSFLLTFDDGRKDSYYPANPILKTLDFHAVMFVIDKYSIEQESNYYLSKEEVKHLSKNQNWEIQSHGYSSHSEYPINDDGEKGHFFSSKLWLEDQARIETTNEYTVRVTQDLQKSKENLEKFGKPVIAFAFPFGDYGNKVSNFPESEKTLTEIVKSVYPLAFYQYSSVYRYSQNYPDPENNNSGRYIRRISIKPEWSGEDLLKVFDGGLAKALPFTATFTLSDGWINTDWGTMELKDNTLELAAIPNNTGSTAFLDGTYLWENYTIESRVKLLKGTNMYLIARYKDDNNYVACNFKDALIHIDQVVDGETRVISGKQSTFSPGEEPFNITMKVDGRNVECTIDGQITVSTSFLDPSLSKGGIGIKTWDESFGNSSLLIENLNVTPN